MSRIAFVFFAMTFLFPIAAFAAEKPSFSDADANGDGKVAVKEAKQAGVPAKEAKEADIDDHGKLTKTDWKFVDAGDKAGGQSGKSMTGN